MATKNLKVGQGLTSQAGSVNIPHPGMILPFAGSTAPSGWLMCDGSSISSSTYPVLYSLIGANTPDLRGKYVIGSNNAVNTSVGANNHTHNFSYASSNTDTHTYSHDHGVYNNAGNTDNVYLAHNHAANHTPYIDGYGNTSTSKSGTSQGNLTNRNHNHSAAGGYWTPNINASGFNHEHSANNATTNTDAPTHSHTIASATGGIFSSNTAINIPPTIYFNFIIKAG